MSTTPALTMQDLELEHAELLPSRETLCAMSMGGTHTLSQVGTGNTAQAGLVNVSALNGSLDNVLGIGIIDIL